MLYSFQTIIFVMYYFLPSAREMFSQASVILSTGQTPPSRADTPRADTPLGRYPRADTPLPSACWDTPPTPTTTTADGTNPIGKHSCFIDR